MSNQITEAFRQQFADNFMHVAQQSESRLEGAVTLVPNIQGSSKSINRLGKRTAQRRTVRHGDTPINEQAHSTRYIDLYDWEDGDMIDDLDIVRTLIDPKSDYVKAMINGMNRAKDNVIITALGAAARTGASTTVGLSRTNSSKAGNADLTSSALTKAKLVGAREYFRANECDEESGEELCLVINSSMLGDLLNDSSLSTAEYNTIADWHAGNIKTGKVMGFRLIHSEQLPAVTTTSGPGGSTIYPATGWVAYAFAKSGVALGMGKDKTITVGVDPSRGFNTRVYAKMALGAVRVEEEKVYEIFAS
jgi:hypothetical protein